MSEKTSSWPSYCRKARCSSPFAGARARPCPARRAGARRGRRPAGTTSAASAVAIRLASSRAHERADDEEARERQPEEERVGRVDDGQHEPGGRGRGEQAARRPRRRTRTRARARPARAAAASRSPAARARCRRRRAPGASAVTATWAQTTATRRADAAEERVPRLVGDERRRAARAPSLVQDDVRRVEEGDTRDEREEAVPERERVAGVQPAVGELVHGVERERVERLELAHAREVEEAVAADLAGDVPEQDAEHRIPRRATHQRPGGAARDEEHVRANDSAARRPAREQQHERQARATPPTANVTASAPKISASDQASVAAAPRSPSARATTAPGEQQDPGREREPQQRHRSSSSGTRPDASQAAASRYIRPRSPRKTAAAQPQRPAEQPPRALGVADAAVLGEEAQVPADVLAEHPAAVRRAADVHALRAREEAHLPAGLAEAVAPVGLLAEEEERLVERADLLDRLAADEHARAHHDLRRRAASSCSKPPA